MCVCVCVCVRESVDVRKRECVGGYLWRGLAFDTASFCQRQYLMKKAGVVTRHVSPD